MINTYSKGDMRPTDSGASQGNRRLEFGVTATFSEIHPLPHHRPVLALNLLKVFTMARVLLHLLWSVLSHCESRITFDR